MNPGNQVWSSQELVGSTATRRVKTSVLSLGTAVNRTNTPLGGGATFTGATVNPFLTQTGAVPGGVQNTVAVQSTTLFAIFADVAGTLNFQFNHSGVGTWRTIIAIAKSANTMQDSPSFAHQWFAGGLYMRFTYVNGGAAQATFEYATGGGTSR